MAGTIRCMLLHPSLLQEREQVNHALRKRKVLLELDPVPFASSANQEGLEEERNEE